MSLVFNTSLVKWFLIQDQLCKSWCKEFGEEAHILRGAGKECGGVGGINVKNKRIYSPEFSKNFGFYENEWNTNYSGKN